MPLIKSDSKQAISKNITTEIEAGKPRRQAVAIALNIARHLRDGGSVEPSEAQKSAGNYKKAHISVHGLDISVENPRGTHRRGVNPHTGRKWAVRMPGHYGYIKRTEGADGDHVDCTVGPDVHSDTVFVIDQNDLDTGKFDEHKCMIGYASETDALRAYRNSFSDGKGNDRIGHVRRMGVVQFKKWLASDKTKEPLRRADGGRVNETLDDYTADYAVPRNDPDSIAGWDLNQPGDLGQGQKLVDETKDWKQPSPPGLDIPAEPPADWKPMGMLERAGRRLTGTMPGEERHQLWPEKMIRSAVTAPGDYLTGAENAPSPGLRREDYTDVPGAPEPSDKMIERAQDLAGLVMGGGLPAAEKGTVRGASAKLTRRVEEGRIPEVELPSMPRNVADEGGIASGEFSVSSDFSGPKLRSGAGDEGAGPVPLGRNEPPTRILADGAKRWEQNGQLHRDDGPAVISPDGTQEWYKNGQLHRDDGPAVISPDGTQFWYQKGKSHREDGPAIVSPDGTQEWFINNEFHREDGPAIVSPDGTQLWYQKGKIHREDGPALIHPNGTQKWYQNDQLHREDGPAIIQPDGAESWYQKGKLHRDDGPAVISPDGTQKWYQNGQLHREDGPAIVSPDGTQFWYQKGKSHREDGPALIHPNGTQEWYKNGQLHRDDGPAIVSPDGTQFWYLNGELYAPSRKMGSDVGVEFSSAVDDTVAKMPTARMTGEQWLSTLKNKPGIKADELEWAGLEEFLKKNEGAKLSQKEVSNFLAANKLELNETKLSKNGTRYQNYATAGTENYRELLFTMPSHKVQGKAFEHGHWPGQKNVVAHTRVGDMVMYNEAGQPKRTLLVDEIQSDWHQRGRDEGYHQSLQPLSETEMRRYRQLAEGATTRILEDEERHEFIGLSNRLALAPKHQSLVSDAPFKKTWQELVLKRMMSEAAAKDYDRLAWTSGEVQSERYRLSRFFDELEVRQSDNPDVVTLFMRKNGERLTNEPTVVPLKELPQYVGRELAEKIAEVKPGESRKFSGLELQKHAPGMTEFYDKIVPRAVEKLGKPWGLKVVRVEPPTVKEFSAARDRAEKVAATDDQQLFLHYLLGLESRVRTKGGSMADLLSAEDRVYVQRNFPELHLLLTRSKSPVWYVDIPKKMREDLAKKGFSLFQRGVPAAAVDDRDRKASGGMVGRTARIARHIRASGTTGPLVSAIGGRTDHLPLEVPQDSYVLPADHVSALGQGNTLNGFAVLNKMFGLPAASAPKPRRAKFASGGGVPVLTAGGEFVVSPEKVAEIGNGDPQRGHEILDQWVVSTRKKHISTLKSLPGPEHS